MTTEPRHDVHIDTRQVYDVGVVIVSCWTCRDFEDELGASPLFEEVVTAVETHTGQPVKCQSMWQRGVMRLFCQQFHGHEGKHRHEDRDFVGEWSDL